MEDVKNRFSDLGVLFISRENEAVIRKELAERNLVFHELFTARPHAFMSAAHPLAARAAVTLVGIELLIATIGTVATCTWIGTGILIRRFYLGHYKIINIILALTLLECIYSILK